MKYYIKICVVLTLVCMMMTGALAAINEVTADKILRNENALRDETMKELFLQMADSAQMPVDDPAVSCVYVISDADKQVIGYCADVSVNGYGGTIGMLVGVNADGSVAGVRIVSHSETKGITESDKRDQLLHEFDGQTGQQKFTDNGGAIEKIAGATVSSKAVLKGVNAAIACIDSLMKGGIAS